MWARCPRPGCSGVVSPDHAGGIGKLDDAREGHGEKKISGGRNRLARDDEKRRERGGKSCPSFTGNKEHRSPLVNKLSKRGYRCPGLPTRGGQHLGALASCGWC